MPSRSRWAAGLLLLLLAGAHAYPDISGSCFGPQGSHVPNAVAAGDDGVYSVDIQDQTPSPDGTMWTAKIVVSDSDGSGVTGFLIKALDLATGGPMGLVDSENLPYGTEIFEGCDGNTSVTHNEENDYELPVSFGVSWPIDKKLAIQAFLVYDVEHWYELWTSSLDSNSTTFPEAQPECSRRSRISAAAVIIGLCPLFIIAFVGILVGFEAFSGLRRTLDQTLPFGQAKATPYSWAWRLCTFDFLAALHEATAGECLAFLLFAVTQALTLIISVYMIRKDAPDGSESSGEGLSPWDASFARGLGHLLMVDFTNVLMMPTRNSVFVPLVGISFERMVKYHRWLGRTAIIVMIVHGGIMIAHWGIHDVFSLGQTCYGYGKIWGSISGILFVVGMAVGSNELIRRWNYDAFKLAHMVSIPALVLAGVHAIDFFFFLIIPFTLYCLDKLMRLADWTRTARILKAQLLPGGVVQLDIQCSGLAQKLYDSGTRGIGTYVMLHCREASMVPGDLHPFSVSGFSSPSNGGNLSSSEKEAITVHIKNMGPNTWTGRLHKAVQNGQVLRCRVEGPYGKLGVRLEDYHTVICWAGGIGFTPMAPLLSMYLSNDPTRVQLLPKLKRLVVVWVVQKNECMEGFDALIQDAKKFIPPADAPDRKLEIMVFTTKESEGEEMRVSSVLMMANKIDPLHRNDIMDLEAQAGEGSDSRACAKNIVAGTRFQKTSGRPVVADVFDRIMPQSTRIDPSFMNGTCVLGCGPAGLMEDVRSCAVTAGIHMHFETFFL